MIYLSKPNIPYFLALVPPFPPFRHVILIAVASAASVVVVMATAAAAAARQHAENPAAFVAAALRKLDALSAAL